MKKLICTTCGSDNVLVDAYAQWNEATQSFELIQTFDKGHFCDDCDGECSVKWEEIKTEPPTGEMKNFIVYNIAKERFSQRVKAINEKEAIKIAHKTDHWENDGPEDSDCEVEEE